ncbi:rRNA maturation RNase YbeY [Candidatus Peregrinibacteria bacterium]|nr:rRNA maturation RNase YbeY [Candidatus Peregrinibacteria bacterium]
MSPSKAVTLRLSKGDSGSTSNVMVREPHYDHFFNFYVNMLYLILNNTTQFSIQKIFFDHILQTCKKILRKEASYFSKNIFSGTLTLILVSDQKIRRLNKIHRKQDSATDVLTFSFLEGMTFPPHNEIGEIYLSMDRAKAQAQIMGHDMFDELRILFIHGVLHAFGFEHENGGREAQVMHDLEKKILEKLEIA